MSTDLLKIACPWHTDYDPIFKLFLHCHCYTCHGCNVTQPNNQSCSVKARLFCPNEPHFKHKCPQCEDLQTEYCPMLSEIRYAHCACIQCCGCPNKYTNPDVCIGNAQKMCRLSPFYRHECMLCSPQSSCPYGQPYSPVHCRHAYENNSEGCCGCKSIVPLSNQCLLPSQTMCPDSVTYRHQCEHCFAKFPWVD